MDTEPQDTVMVAVRIPPDLRQWLEARATEDDRSMSSIVRLALAEYRDRLEKSTSDAA